MQRISRKMLFASAGILILGCVAMIMWWDVIKQLYPAQSLIDSKIDRLKEAKRELRKEVDTGKKVEKWLNHFRMIVKNNFINESDAASLRKRLEVMARERGVMVMTIGTPSVTKFKGGNFWQLNFSCYGTMKNLMEFFEDISANENKILWRRFSLRPVSTRSTESLRLTATFCAFSMDSENLDKLENKKAAKSKSRKQEKSVSIKVKTKARDKINK